jgi:hypothetical protein
VDLIDSDINQWKDTDVQYTHCRQIDRLAKSFKNKPWLYHHIGDPEFDEAREDYDSDEEFYRAMVDSIIEYQQGNPSI